MLRKSVLIGVVAAAIGSSLLTVGFATPVNNGPAAKPVAKPPSKVAALAGWEMIKSAEFLVSPNSSAELVAECPADKVPLGGGFSKHPSTPDSQPGFEVASSFPAYFTFQGSLFSGWVVHAINRGPANAFVTVWAACAATTSKTLN